MDTIEMPKLPENQKTFAGIPEAIFLVSTQKWLPKCNSNLDRARLNQLWKISDINHQSYCACRKKLIRL